MAAFRLPFCISPGCSVGPVTTNTKDQRHITVFLKREVHFAYPLLVMSNCYGTTAQYNTKTSTTRWVLILVFPVLYVTCYDPWSSHSVINVLAPFDGYVQIPSREFFLHFRFLLRFSTRSRCYCAPFFPHSVYIPRTFQWSLPLSFPD
jgi:hypothetical protein